MTTVLHALSERDKYDRDMHIRHWYGTVPPNAEDWDEDPEHPVVCWCGGRHVQLAPNVYAVWHVQEWRK